MPRYLDEARRLERLSRGGVKDGDLSAAKLCESATRYADAGMTDEDLLKLSSLLIKMKSAQNIKPLAKTLVKEDPVPKPRKRTRKNK